MVEQKGEDLVDDLASFMAMMEEMMGNTECRCTTWEYVCAGSVGEP
jgi:hypothetical protein